MIRVEVEVMIKCPPEEVFDYIANFENNPLWQSGMVEAKFTSQGSLRVGSTYTQRATFMGRPVESIFEVVAYEPGHMVQASTTSGSFPITFTRMVEPENGGTRVKAIIEGDAGGFMKLAEPLMAPMVRRSINGDYANLKRILEADC